MERFLCLLIGYGFGCVITAEYVVKKITGKRPQEIGTGNPGMANVMDQLGLKAGLIVLAGDLFKTLAVCMICQLLFGKTIGNISILYAGMGALLGHNYPFWNHFKGGKGVAVTCMFSTAYLPLWGFLCCVAGAVVVLATGYLSVGGIVIPFLYLVPAFFFGGMEACMLAVISMILMVVRHYSSLQQVLKGEAKKKLLFRKKSDNN